MSFHNIRFPEEVSFGALGGTMRKVDVVTLANGREIRSTPWRQNRRQYHVGTGIKSRAALYEVMSFFEARRGKLHGFRYKDWTDFQSCAPGAVTDYQDQIIGFADGIETQFQLMKNYRSGDETAKRIITKPVRASVKIGVDDLPYELGTHFDVDEMTGFVRFYEPPETGAPIYAGFEFDVPVRFDCDELMVSLSQFDAGEVADIPLVEVLE